MLKIITLFFILFSNLCLAEEKELFREVPVSYKGRIRPFESYARSLQQESKVFLDANLLLLPSRHRNGQWLPLILLDKEELNFTLYSEQSFQKIKNAYKNWKEKPDRLAEALGEAYQEIEGLPIARGSSLTYPSRWQLKAEVFAIQTPLISIAILSYVLSLFFLLIPNRKAGFLGILFLTIAFSIHTLSLLLRTYILGRPPVSNMFETVVYVPWIAILASFLLARRYMTRYPLIASTILTIILLSILEFTHLSDSFENVQAVLNSQFWLIIHVLMIVGSYGILLLAGLLGHIYLVCHFFRSSFLEPLKKSLLQAIYLGVALLIPGTILGGVWAAQSWGRFWDWDPKESWAFISACVYLITIHLYRFNIISFIGLAIGSIIGLGFISFTWYGVNYILGTGLHSYGFGKASHHMYILFLLIEALFITIMAYLLYRQKISIEKKKQSDYKI